MLVKHMILSNFIDFMVTTDFENENNFAKQMCNGNTAFRVNNKNINKPPFAIVYLPEIICPIMALQAEPPATFPAAAYARHLCRLCMCSREQTARQRLAHIEWFKWPSAEITRLYEQVVGEQVGILLGQHRFTH